MKKKLLAALILTFLSLLLWGIGKLYIAYNLSHYAGYYVQHMPRKEETNPEMVIVLKYLNDIEKPTTNNLFYDLDGNGAVIVDNQLILSYMTDMFNLYPTEGSENYILDVKNGSFLYHVKNLNFQEKDDSKPKELEAKKLLDKILPPILEAQPKPKINLQKLFNEKYYKQFNE
ncbi:hypothetical protein J5571_05610 [Streptococcus suis]|uniref:hypothetical protein n=1 Tax=Streptococcus suis TaxID=1307 RepID=UPI00192D25BF|nr:hypothetical protein [Streptococcus suis]MBL6503924.1 hypothetical protein [Streptococcus suis]MBM0242015.1 hypothetical protein [Streptococcus suis]MBM7204163.1 hypothetical protein [Streptococcus suis]MBM7281228.1 hypothetical protein [Streptococcus suis]MBO4116011.1 hypothetical protein [Streptococcus suis]